MWIAEHSDSAAANLGSSTAPTLQRDQGDTFDESTPKILPGAMTIFFFRKYSARIKESSIRGNFAQRYSDCGFLTNTSAPNDSSNRAALVVASPSRARTQVGHAVGNAPRARSHRLCARNTRSCLHGSTLLTSVAVLTPPVTAFSCAQHRACRRCR